MVASGQVVAPPAFVRLAGHPLRWQLLTALSGGDHRVRELVTLVDQSQNLVSYHLRLLRDAGFVTTTRSTFDGRDSYYHLDLGRCAEAMAATGAALHPALGTGATPPARPAGRGIAVLFVCTGNSARSPIAEALLRHHTGGRVQAVSAGTRPRPELHPGAVRVLGELFGIDVRDQLPQHVDVVGRRRFDRLITLCDKARESRFEFAQPPPRAHWSIPDPVGADDLAFRRIAADIDTRVRYLLPTLTASQHEEVSS
ncbi:ArsR family transcriptional regulator [Lentzea sp. HUAS TT2]|uniref:arsenate reductase/protein-tyrosine-phosphatase family protein n=1 Tax=Lentzea sp. HUAS TT2 TaxID=3447454 RepID=UPI003F72365B